MTADDRPAADAFEERIAAFESAWRAGSRPKIRAFLPDAGDVQNAAARLELSLELIQIDLEFRWRKGKRRGPLLEWYLKHFPELGTLDAIPPALVAQEYRVRKRWGDGPSHSEYVARFPRGGLALIDALAGVDVDLADEGLPVASEKSRTPNCQARVDFDPDAPLHHSDYHLKRQIGSGSMCRVYTAVQVSLDKPVAVKVLHKKRLKDELAVQRFRREARLTALLRHDGIVGVHGLGRLPDGGYFMVLDLVSGQDLSRLGVVESQRASRIVARLAEIVAHVHDSGFIHCDLKPANVLIDEGDNVFLTDFGLARPFDVPADSLFGTQLAGTPAYMAPEQIDLSFGPVGPWTDVYGLGGILHTLLFGQPPFVGTAEEILTRKKMRRDLESRNDLTEDQIQLLRICCECLRPSMCERMGSAKMLIKAIRLQ